MMCTMIVKKVHVYQMEKILRIGIIGDYDPNRASHIATNEALDHAAGELAVTVEFSWLHTESLDQASAEKTLKQFDAFWCAPGSPYASFNGALNAIRFARENGKPFLGT